MFTVARFQMMDSRCTALALASPSMCTASVNLREAEALAWNIPQQCRERIAEDRQREEVSNRRESKSKLSGCLLTLDILMATKLSSQFQV